MTLKDHVYSLFKTYPTGGDYFDGGYHSAFYDYEVVKKITVGDYQGDYYFLVRDGGRYGLSVIGYGSCSGCDALEGAQEAKDDVLELFESIRAGIHWEPSKDEMRAYIRDRWDKGIKLSYCSNEEEAGKTYSELIKQVS